MSSAREIRTISDIDALERDWGLSTIRTQNAGLETRPWPTEPERKPLKVITGEDVFHSEFKEPEPIIDRLLYPGLTIFTGRPKCGKSWWALQIAIAIARGERLGSKLRVRKAGRVLYLALEESQRRTAPRVRKLTGPCDSLKDIAFVYEIDPLNSGGAEQLDTYLKDFRCELVVVDTYFAFARQADRKAVDILQNDYNQITILRELAQKHDCAILLVHHSRKAGGESVDTVLGTTGFTAACDAIWNLRKQPNSGDSVLAITGREMEETVYGMRLEQGESFGWKIVGEGADVTLTEQRREIADLLRTDGPLSPKDIAAALGKNPNTIRRLLQPLLRDGFISKSGELYRLIEGMNA